MQDSWTAAKVMRPEGTAPVVLVCEHASRAIPTEFGDLGLTKEARVSHAAWDIGARDLAVEMSTLMNAPLVLAGVSRLVYDLNRPLESISAIPEVSEIFQIPGNQTLSDAERQNRFDKVHVPFHASVADVLNRQVARVSGPISLVTIHTFTAVYLGQKRDVEIGYLYHEDDSFAQSALMVEQVAGRYRTALNEPYAATDGVTHTLKLHGEDNGVPALMIEVRNDLVDTPDKARDMATHLVRVLSAASHIEPNRQEAAG